MIDMHSTMMENGLDFILDAANKLKHSKETDDIIEKRKDIKYSLLHLLSGIELVMKARLFIENWTYIFSKMDLADRHKLASGDFISIEYSKCIERLERLCDISISDDDKETFEYLRQSRNRVEHFYSQESVEAIGAKIDKALKATIIFITSNLEEFEDPSVVDLRKNERKALSHTEKQYIQDINAVIAELGTYHQEALNLAIKRAESISLPNELMICPDCGEKTLVINDDDANNGCHCYFCNYKDDGEMTAQKYLSNVLRLNAYRIVKDGGEYPLYYCPECGQQSLIEVGNQYVCFSCRMMYDKDEIKKCEECGTLYVCYDESDDGLCGNCKEWRREIEEKE